MKSSPSRTWIYSHRNILPVPFIMLALLGFILTEKKAFSLALDVSGWLLILAGESLRVWSVGYAGATTRSMKLRAERLVTGGPYARVRNPIYLGNFSIGLGFCVVAGVWWIFPLYLAYFVVQYRAIISVEEEFLGGKFGADYKTYRERVPRVIPRLIPSEGSESSEQGFQAAALSGEYWTVLGIFFAGAVLEALKFLV